MPKTLSTVENSLKVDNGDGTWKTVSVKDLWTLMKAKEPLLYSDADLIT